MLILAPRGFASAFPIVVESARFLTPGWAGGLVSISKGSLVATCGTVHSNFAEVLNLEKLELLKLIKGDVVN